MVAAPPPPRLSEAEAGMDAHLWPEVAGFEGRFKERWQDFHVHEIDLNGTELHLSQLITPGGVAAELKAASLARREARAALGEGFTPEPEVEDALKSALGDGPTAQLIAFLRSQRGSRRAQASAQQEDVGSEDAKGVCEGVPVAAEPSKEVEPPAFVDLEADKLGDGSKEARKAAHKAVLGAFGEILNTETVEAEGGARQLRVWMRDAELRIKTQGGAQEKRATDGGRNGKDDAKGQGKGKGKGKKGKKGKGKGKKGSEADDADADAQGGASEFGTLRREGWPKDRPDYLYFRLYKENCDTGEAVMSIARCVGRSAKQFTYAGTKDRRASTVQQICAHRLPADQLRRTVVHRAWDRRLRISDLEYRPNRLRLGELRGNRFHVVLRGVPPEAIAGADGGSTGSGDSGTCVAGRAFAAVSAGGFLNYYGLQRFGTRQVRTHQVGAAIIAGDCGRAVRLILGDDPNVRTPDAASVSASGTRKRPLEEAGADVGVTSSDADATRPAKAARTEDAEMAVERPSTEEGVPEGKRPRWQLIREAARLYLEEGNAQRALEAMPKSQHLERCVLGALARGLPPMEVLRQIPHQALSLYAHAAQSLVWNSVLSRRIRELGSRPVRGDLVLAAGQAANLAESVPDEALDDADALGDAEDPEGDAGDADADAIAGSPGQLPEVRELETDADAEACGGLCEVMLPLPGSGVRYPPRLRSFYEEAARDLLGLELDDFHKLTALVPLRGAYRAAVVRPLDLHWRRVLPSEVAQASSPGGAPLVPTDVARLLAERGPVPGGGGDSLGGEVREAPASETPAPAAEATKDERAAVVFSCVLPPSAYLTMLLREVTKQSTASPHLVG